jgi:hypothetical protein
MMFELLLDVMDRACEIPTLKMRHSPVPSKVSEVWKGLMNPIRYFFGFRIRNFVTPIIESVRTPARITPYPTGRLFWGGDRGRDKVGFAPPTEPDWHISCIRLSSWWLAFKKIGVPQCALVLRRTSPPRRSRYLAIGSDLFLWPGLFASSGA